VVQDSDSDQVRFSLPMKPDDVADVTRDARARGFALLHYRPSGVYVETSTRWTDYDQTRNAEPHRRVADLLAPVPSDVAKVIWLGDAAAVDGTLAQVHARYDGRLTVTRTDPPYLEFNAPAVNKATALAAVAELLGAAQSEIVAFGDGNNDAAMLAWAGMGVAMPHARASAKAAANRVGPDGDPETALARAIEMVLA
jgi:hypothetical protein